jgi:SAM-dependent methyltransferase
MKDIVENRSRIELSQKLGLARLVVKENGLRWSLLMGLYYLGSGMAEAGFKRAESLRRTKGLPGLNSPAANKYIWQNWDWAAGGDEWTPSAEWKASVVGNFVDPLFSGRSTILEIGPGAGRWTEYLVTKCDRLIGIDISETCVAECREKFAQYPHASFEVGSGEDLQMIDTNSIDGLWSFDVFVHINKPQLRSYAAEFARILKPGGIGLIHHGSLGGSTGGWRSDVRTADVHDALVENGLTVDRQIQSWEDGGQQFEAGLYQDTITVFEKPVD